MNKNKIGGENIGALFELLAQVNGNFARWRDRQVINETGGNRRSDHPFTLPGTLNKILSFLPEDQWLETSLTSRLFRSVAHTIMDDSFVIRCPISDFLTLSSDGSLKIHLSYLESEEDIEKLINFLKDPINETVLARLESIAFGAILGSNKNKVQELLGFLCEKSEKLPKLENLILSRSLKLKDIPASVTSITLDNAYSSNDMFQSFPPKVTSLTLCEFPDNLGDYIDLRSTKLTSLNIGNILYRGRLTLELPDSLITFYIYLIDRLANLSLEKFPPNLVSIFFGYIRDQRDYYLNLPELPSSVTSFSYERIMSNPYVEERFKELKKQVDERNEKKVNYS